MSGEATIYMFGAVLQLFTEIKKVWKDSRDFSGKYRECEGLVYQLDGILMEAVKDERYSETKKELFRSLREDLEKINIKMIRIHDKLAGRSCTRMYGFQLTKQLKSVISHSTPILGTNIKSLHIIGFPIVLF